MALRECDKCGEKFDEAKAFCPGCGKAFVEEEKRKNISDFEKQDSTVQLGKTMYNQMLANMGLNISKGQVEKRVEVIAPVGETKAEAAKVPAAPVFAERPAAEKPSDEKVEQAKRPGRGKWIAIWVVLIVFLLPPALASTVDLIYELLLRFLWS